MPSNSAPPYVEPAIVEAEAVAPAVDDAEAVEPRDVGPSADATEVIVSAPFEPTGNMFLTIAIWEFEKGLFGDVFQIRIILRYLRCLLASAARSWSGGTRTARGGCQMPPPYSWWALETPLTLARRGSGRRPSGGHGGGGGAIGGEIVHQPPSHVLFFTPPSMRGTRSQECGRSWRKEVRLSRGSRSSCFVGSRSAVAVRT